MMQSLKENLLENDSNSKSRTVHHETPYCTNASLLSTLTFSWISYLFALSNEKTLYIDELPQVSSNNSSFRPFRTHVGAKNVTEFTLVKALFSLARKEIIWTGLLAIMYAVSSSVCPYLIESFVQRLSKGVSSQPEGYILALTFFVATLFGGLINRHWKFKLQQVGMRFRVAISSLIYNKSLVLSSRCMQDQTSGELVNLVAVDVGIIDSFTQYIHDCWLIILQVCLGLLILYMNLGVSSFAALAGIVIVMLSNYGIGKLQESFQRNLMKSKDDRMKMTMESLRNMRILKLQGWEMRFLSKIFRLRKVGSLWLRKYMYNSALMSFMFGIASQ